MAMYLSMAKWAAWIGYKWKCTDRVPWELYWWISRASILTSRSFSTVLYLLSINSSEPENKQRVVCKSLIFPCWYPLEDSPPSLSDRSFWPSDAARSFQLAFAGFPAASGLPDPWAPRFQEWRSRSRKIIGKSWENNQPSWDFNGILRGFVWEFYGILMGSTLW